LREGREEKGDKYKQWVRDTRAFKVGARKCELREGNSEFLL